MTNDPDLVRRHLIGGSLPMLGAVLTTSPIMAEAVKPAAEHRSVNVFDFGALGDGQANDGPAFLAALKAGRIVNVPAGRFRIDKPIVLRDGQVLRGTGRGGWEPYTGHGTSAAVMRSEIVVDSGTAIDVRDTNNAAISGLALRTRDARQSAWAYDPGFQRGTIAIDLAGALQFTAQDVSFHGFEIGVSGVADDGRTAQMPAIDDWSAHDCDTVFRLVSASPGFVAVRDARIAGGIAALHCGRVVEARRCDGLRIENVRFFQCTRNAALIEDTPFVAITGATMFETGDETLVLRRCTAVTMAGVQLVRAGFYHAPPRVQRAALLLEQCIDLTFDGLIEQPMGRAATIRDCGTIAIAGAIGTPFWSTGSLGSNDGAIFIERSHDIAINASFGGDDYWFAVFADAQSKASIGGRIVCPQSAGTNRCVQLQPSPLGHVARTAMEKAIPPSQTLLIDTLRIPVPAGGVLVSRSVELTGTRLVAQIGDQRWTTASIEPGGGSLSLERRILHRNDTAEMHYASIPLGLHNPAATPVSVPGGHELRLSLAIETARAGES
jgi:Pectate lyase superfamily protein